MTSAEAHKPSHYLTARRAGQTAGASTAGVGQLIERAQAGDARALARLISLVENGSPELRPIMKALAPLTGRARMIGLTGAPGVGKSTVTGALVAAYRKQGQRVGVLAVDPTSPFTGGALLGDRIRMQDHATDPDVFIRSMASRGHLGGLARATPQALRALDAAGFGVNLVETGGVGPAEVIAELAGKIGAHWAWLDESGEGEARRRARAREEISAIAVAELRRRVDALPGEWRLDTLADKVAAGEIDPFTAADEVVAAATS